MAQRMKALTAVFLLLGLQALAGCSSTPVQPEMEGVVFESPTEVVQKAGIDALVVTGFDVEKVEPLYIEGFRPRKIGLLVGSGGETVGIWLENLGPSKTRVRVDTAKSFVGIVGQKNWNTEVLAEMIKTLRK